MKVRIQHDSDTPGYTARITNAETGELLEYVYKVNVLIDVNHPVLAVIHTYFPVLDVIADAEIRQICPCCGKRSDSEDDTLALEK